MTELALTPSQTAGPYLTIGLIDGPIGNELVDESDARAIRISGVLLDGAGDPVTDGLVEIWQANAAGRYAHPADDREEIPLEPGFWGFGRSSTADGGRFELVTVKPGRVPWVDGRLQAPHVVVGVFARGLLKRVATRMYFPDEETANAEDPVLLALEPEERAALVARADGGALLFDIVLQGAGQTTFFAV
jgi:protocatechuate 3,4-dioxygenase alpha subunit